MQLTQMETLTNSQWLVSIAQMPGVYWTSSGEAALSMERASYVDPIGGIMRSTASGMLSYDDIELSKSFDTVTDWDLIRSLDNFLKEGVYLSASMSPVKRNAGIQLLGNRRIDLENLLVKSLKAPGSIDVSDGKSVSVLSITCSVEYVRFETNKTTD